MKSRRLFLIVFLCMLVVVSSRGGVPEGEPFRIKVEGEMRTAEQVLSLYIQKKSLSGDEVLAGEWLKNVCNENGLIIEQFGNSNGNYNFSASLFPLSDSLPNILFLNHIDVVPEGDVAQWEHPPWSGYISETEVWGRGAFDNKGAAIMQLFAILKYKSNSKDLVDREEYNITFLAVSCEETQCGGGASFVVEEALEALHPVLVIGEGATELSSLVDPESDRRQFGISVTQKRPCWLKLSTEIETSGHGSAPPSSYANKELTIALSRILEVKQKPIFTMVNRSMLRSLGANEGGITGFVLRHPVFFQCLIVPQLRAQPELFSLYSNTIALTSLGATNTTINYIPGSAEAFLDCRLMPGFSSEDFIAALQEEIDNENIRIESVLEMGQSSPSSWHSDFYQCMEEAVKTSFPDASVYPMMLPNFNDVAWFRAAGIQGLSIIPVEMNEDHIKCIHKENERIPILALHQGVETYYVFIQKCMSN